MSPHTMPRTVLAAPDAARIEAVRLIGTAHPPRRLSSIDVLRGLVIVLMALDHVREYLTDVRFDPLDFTRTHGLLYATRWITHFCAPVFIFLAGMSAYLLGGRIGSVPLSRVLFTRGLWLVALEFTVVNFAWNFNFRYDLGLIFQVIGAIGVSMMVLAALVRLLSVRTVGMIGLVLCVGHNLLDPISPSQFGALAPLWNVLHVQGPTTLGYVHYPLIPWVGVMALGYGLGSIYEMEPIPRRRMLATLGLLATSAFILLRLSNVYGDPQPWAHQHDIGTTLMSFLNVQKYPPSLLYLLATLGPALVMLAVLERVRGAFASVFETFGRVPLFFYVLHIMLAHLVAGLLALSMGFGTSVLGNMFLTFPPDWGVGLGAVYVAWLLVVVTLYPACRWFARLKARRHDWWLYYL